MSRLRIYGDTSGYLDLVAPDSARNNVINLDGILAEDSNGNVGIGTASPENKLDVRGDIKIQDTIPEILFRSPDGSSNQYFIGANISDAVDGGFIIGEGSGITGGTARVAIDASGKVGIGTDAPAQILHLADSDVNTRLLVENTNSGSPKQASVDLKTTVREYRFISDFDGKFNIFDQTGASSRFTILTSGNVGIGTTTPSSMLDVNGDLRVQGNFTVDGTTTTINSTTLNVDDVNITVASGAADAAAADGAGLTVDGASATLTYVSAGDNWSFNKDLNLDGDLTVGGNQVTMANVATRDKYRVWNSSTYAIGMDNGISFGGLNDFAMTFQMNDQADRGYWFGDAAHTDAQGAMALTTQGKLTVAHSARIGHGEADTTAPGATHRLDVNGSIADDVSDVRTPRYSAFTSGSAANETITNEGVYNINSAAATTTLTLGAPAAGTVMCIYNNKSTSVTLNAGSTITAMRKGADNNATHNATLTLGANSITTITIVLISRAIVTGTDVS